MMIDDMNVIQELGCGFSANVQLVQRRGQLMALKVFKEQQQMYLENESRIMQLLQNIPGVVHFQGVSQGCIMMDYAKSGNMLTYLKEGLPENIARAYFTQLITILADIHKQGIAHRDLKLENILLDEEFRLLLCDFGFAVKFIDDAGHRVKINNYVGTPQTIAPELFLQQPYNAVEADLFQLGVILFQLNSGLCPFKTANIKTDPLYSLIYKNQVSKFWDHHKLKYSPQLKDLIIRLLAFNPNQRLSINEILTHPWLQYQSAAPEVIFTEMHKRQQQM